MHFRGKNDAQNDAFYFSFKRERAHIIGYSEKETIPPPNNQFVGARIFTAYTRQDN